MLHCISAAHFLFYCCMMLTLPSSLRSCSYSILAHNFSVIFSAIYSWSWLNSFVQKGQQNLHDNENAWNLVLPREKQKTCTEPAMSVAWETTNNKDNTDLSLIWDQKGEEESRVIADHISAPILKFTYLISRLPASGRIVILQDMNQILLPCQPTVQSTCRETDAEKLAASLYTMSMIYLLK